MIHGEAGLSKKISNDQELIQSDPTSCPQSRLLNKMILLRLWDAQITAPKVEIWLYCGCIN